MHVIPVAVVRKSVPWLYQSTYSSIRYIAEQMGAAISQMIRFK